jgi:putative membrane protein
VTSLAILALPLLIAGALWLLLFLWASTLAGSSPGWFFGQSFGTVAVVLLPAMLYPLLVGTRWLAWRRTGFALTKDLLLIRSGWWRRRTALLPLTSVQSIDLTENAFTRRFGVARLTIGVAGGSGFAGHSIPALPRERASQLREALLSRFA